MSANWFSGVCYSVSDLEDGEFLFVASESTSDGDG